jgi:hypothetical protein
VCAGEVANATSLVFLANVYFTLRAKRQLRLLADFKPYQKICPQRIKAFYTSLLLEAPVCLKMIMFF